MRTVNMNSMLQDLRHAGRMMGRSPGFTAAALLTLALAIGANTAVFSVVYGVLLRPLPYRDAGRIVRLSEEHPGGTSIIRNAMLSNVTFAAWRTNPQTIEGLSAYTSEAYVVTSLDEPSRVVGANVQPSLFQLLGVTPAAGRFFRDEDAIKGADGVVVLSHSMWRRRFGGDPAAIGKTMDLNGRSYEIVGVAPAWFYFPDREAQLWTPYSIPPVDPRGMSVLYALARLKPGASEAQAAAEGTAVARGTKRPFAAELLFGKGAPVEVRARVLADQMTARIRPAMLVLMASVGLVLLIACANVANLLLARGVSRGRELAVRAALGAGRGRLVRQLLTESAALGLAGGALGVLLAWAITRAVPAWAPDGFPRLEDIQLDFRVLGFAVVVSLVAGALAGVLPALRAGRTNLIPALRADDARSVGAGERVRAVLLALEAALSVVLLIGAALLVRSFVTLINVNPGYDATNVLNARVYLTGAASKPERAVQIVDSLVERLNASAGVVAAGAGSMAPLNQSTAIAGFSFRASAGAEEVKARAISYAVTPGYAEALRLRLIEGRMLQPSDATSGIQAMVVNEAFVQAYMTDGKPVAGRRYQGLMAEPEVTTEIVGVVNNVLKDGLDRQPQPEMYFAHSKHRRITREINLVIRTASDPAAFTPTLRSAVRDIEPTAALDEVGTLASRVSESVGQPRFATAVLAMFATLALVLAATGLYGVLSYSVSQRRREIGIRSALGATRGNLIGLVVRQGLIVTVVGLVLGMLASVLATRLMQPLLFGITPLDVPSFAVMPAILLMVAMAACVVPARRAAATDPAETLRSE
jgi:putative ABC transport system permease protein